MISSELRIGNIVQSVYNDTFGISQETLCDFANGYVNLKPITLTEEWLLKFAFEWSIWHQAWHRLGFVFDLSERGVAGYYMHMVKRNNDIICPEIIYVHQLQNLYFALTGEELKIK